MNPTARLSTRFVQLASIAAATVVLTACAANQQPQPAPVTTPATPAAVVPVDPQPVAHANAAQLLTQYLWSITKVTSADGTVLNDWLIADKPAPGLKFENSQVSVQNLCNLVSASYNTNLDKIEITRPIATMRACVDEPKMLQERKVILQLPLAQRYEVFPATGNQPIRALLYFNDGVRWQLAGSPTPATRFGSAGERIFLEVYPEKVACNNPLMRDAKCLRVRDLSFDNQGIKRVTGDWRTLQGEIEGYKFEPGLRNVLRVNRYPIVSKDGVRPADAPKHAYVLDMIVESERVR